MTPPMKLVREKMFPMLDGPKIPWTTAETIYRAYSCIEGPSCQTLERLAERGGFGWGEVGIYMKKVQHKQPKLHREIRSVSQTSGKVSAEQRVKAAKALHHENGCDEHHEWKDAPDNTRAWHFEMVDVVFTALGLEWEGMTE